MPNQFEKELGTKSFDDIVEYTLDAIIQKGVGLDNVNYNSVLRTLVEVGAENEDTLNYYIEYVYSCMNIDNCVGEDLDRSIKILGIVREPAKPAIGEVTLYSGDSPAESDIEIPYGLMVSTKPDSNGNTVEFIITDTDKVLHAGESEVNVTVECTEPGLIYITSGSISTLVSSLDGIHSVKNVNPINGGSDIESDEELRDRVNNIRETFGKCTDDAISEAVKNVNGVINARVIDIYKGRATTGVIVVTDTLPPPESVANNISNVVANTKAAGIEAFIVYATVNYIDVDITLTNISDSDYIDISDAIKSYCMSLEPGQKFIVKQLERKILNAIDKTVSDNDTVDIVTNSPSENIDISVEEVIRARNITINGVTMS